MKFHSGNNNNNNHNYNNNNDDEEDDDDAGRDDHHLRLIRHTSGTNSTCYANNATKNTQNCSQQQRLVTNSHEQNLNELKNIKQEIMTSAVAVVEADDADTTEHLCNLCPQVSTHQNNIFQPYISIASFLYCLL